MKCVIIALHITISQGTGGSGEEKGKTTGASNEMTTEPQDSGEKTVGGSSGGDSGQTKKTTKMATTNAKGSNEAKSSEESEEKKKKKKKKNPRGPCNRCFRSAMACIRLGEGDKQVRNAFNSKMRKKY